MFAAGHGLRSERPLSGVVNRCSEVACQVAFEELPDHLNLSSHDGSLQLVKLANDVTYRRLKR